MTRSATLLSHLGKFVWRARRISTEVARELACLVIVAAHRIAGPTPRAPGARLRVLVVDEMVPDPRFGAGYPRAAQILHALAAAGCEVFVYPMMGARSDYATVRGSFPPSVRFVWTQGAPGLRRLMRRESGRFDVALVSRPPVIDLFSRLCRELPRFRQGLHVVHDAEAVFAVRDRARTALFDAVPMSGAAFDDQVEAEIALAREADAVLAVSESEAQLFRDRIAALVHVVGHCVSALDTTPCAAGRRDLLFVGRLSGPRELAPNVDGLIWFVEIVMPRLDALVGSDWQLLVAGLVDADLVKRLGSTRVSFEGVVDDLSALYNRCRVFIAPTRFAAGIPLKVIEACAAGVPCVVTELLAQQLNFHEGQVEVGANADGFAAACARLMADDETWARVAAGGLEASRKHYSTEAFERAVRSALVDGVIRTQLVARGPAAAA